MKSDLERLLAMLCNEQTDPSAYQFVLKQILELIDENR